MSTLFEQVAQPQRKCIKRYPSNYNSCPSCGILKYHRAPLCRRCKAIANHAPYDPETYIIGDDACRRIALTQGMYSLVNEAKFVWLSRWMWAAQASKIKSRYTWYATTYIRLKDGSLYHVGMHRLLLGLIPGDMTRADHENGDGLDNRISNLRDSTYGQNGANSRLYANNSSGYRGVSWRDKLGKWAVNIKINKEQVHLGFYEDKAEAAMVWDVAAFNEYGEFARLNFPKLGTAASPKSTDLMQPRLY